MFCLKNGHTGNNTVACYQSVKTRISAHSIRLCCEILGPQVMLVGALDSTVQCYGEQIARQLRTQYVEGI